MDFQIWMSISAKESCGYFNWDPTDRVDMFGGELIASLTLNVPLLRTLYIYSGLV